MRRGAEATRPYVLEGGHVGSQFDSSVDTRRRQALCRTQALRARSARVEITTESLSSLRHIRDDSCFQSDRPRYRRSVGGGVCLYAVRFAVPSRPERLLDSAIW